MELNSNVVIITSGAGNKVFIEKYANLIRNIFEGEVVLITTGDFHLDPKNFVNIKTKHIYIPYSFNPLGRIKSYLLSQFLIARNIPEDSEIALFFLAQSLIIPMIWLKFLRKKIILILGSSDYQVSKSKRGITLFLPLLEKLAFKMSDYIVLYSNNLKKECNLENYDEKIKIAHRHFLDFQKFRCFKPYEKRDKIIGFVGRLSNEKGIINFIESMPAILKKDSEIKFLIIGDGILRSRVLELLNDLNLSKNVKVINEVSFKDIPSYLNELKLLVLPSYTEGLPNVVIEAMACKTPVLATSVGAVPDIIKDGENGFIIRKNTPVCISESVINVLEDKDILKVINNSENLVRSNFNYEQVFSDYKILFSNIK